jgi:PKD repeat protein
MSTTGSDSIGITVTDNLQDSYTFTVPVNIGNYPSTGSLNFSVGTNMVPYTATVGITGVTAGTGTITNYNYNFGDGTSQNSTATSITHDYLATGSYTITITATNSIGLSSTSSHAFVVNQYSVPLANFTVSTSSLYAFSTSIVNPGTGPSLGTNYTWNWGDGLTNGGVTSAVTNESHTYANAGTYTLKLRGTNPGNGVLVGSTTVTPGTAVGATGYLPFAYINVYSLREQVVNTAFNFDGYQYSFDPNVGGGLNQEYWNFGDYVNCTNGCTATDSNQTHTYTAAGSYPVTMTFTDVEGGSSTTSTTVYVVNSGHAPRVVETITPTSGVAPLTVSGNASGSYDYDGTIANYDWNWGDGSADASTAVASHTYTTPGTYFINTTVTDNSGNPVTVSTLVTVTASLAMRMPMRLTDLDPNDPDYDQAQDLTNACAKNVGAACNQLAQVYLQEGDSNTASTLEARACTLGYTAACGSR